MLQDPSSHFFYRPVPYLYSKLRSHFSDCYSFHVFFFPTYCAEAQDYLHAVPYKTSSLKHASAQGL